MNIEQYIETGIIEAYVMGMADPVEKGQFEQILSSSPALQRALSDFELKIEEFAMRYSSPPPPGTWEMIEDRIRELPIVPPAKKQKQVGWQGGNGSDRHPEFIPVHESSSTHIRVHKNWRTAFIIIFILSKIFLVLSIYYFLEYRYAQKDILLLQQQVNRPAR